MSKENFFQSTTAKNQTEKKQVKIDEQQNKSAVKKDIFSVKKIDSKVSHRVVFIV